MTSALEIRARVSLYHATDAYSLLGANRRKSLFFVNEKKEDKVAPLDLGV
jgi:hypothetical protein